MASPLQNLGVMRKTITLILAIVVAAGSTGCQTLMNIENPEYTFRDIRPRVSVAIPFSASTVDVDFNVEVRNPNSVGLNLDQIDFDLLINNERVLTSVSNQNVRIPANGTGTVELRTRFGYDNARTVFRELIDWVQGDRANYELRGKVYYDTPMGRMQFPLTVYRRSV